METSELRGYEVIRPLGQGGFGKTFLVRDRQSSDQKQYVIKQLILDAIDPTSHEMAQERFQKEATVLLELGRKHNQIPKLYSYFFHDQNFYLVQEFVDGLTLGETVSQQGPLPEDFVRQTLIQVLEILEVIHGEQIIHRDIKPDNILIRTHDQKPVLIDFGAVKACVNPLPSQRLRGSTIVIGSPGFIAPEQAVGRPGYGSDLYSLGMTAIYLLTGKPPDELETELGTNTLSWQQYAPNLSPELAVILERAIQLNPGDRYPAAAAMRQALLNLSLPKTIAAVRTALSPITRGLPPTQRSIYQLRNRQPAVLAILGSQLLKPSRWLWGMIGGVAIASGALGLGGFHLYKQHQAQAFAQTAQNLQAQGQFQACLNHLEQPAGRIPPLDSLLGNRINEITAHCRLGLAKQLAAQGRLTTALSQVRQIPLQVAALTEARRLEKQWLGKLTPSKSLPTSAIAVQPQIQATRSRPTRALNPVSSLPPQSPLTRQQPTVAPRPTLAIAAPKSGQPQPQRQQQPRQQPKQQPPAQGVSSSPGPQGTTSGQTQKPDQTQKPRQPVALKDSQGSSNQPPAAKPEKKRKSQPQNSWSATAQSSPPRARSSEKQNRDRSPGSESKSRGKNKKD